jgi:predicted protein tyrosine phosphatase
MMDELPNVLPVDHVTDGIYISGWRATLYIDHLREAKITNVLKLFADEPHFPADFNVCVNALADGEVIPPGVLKRGVDFVIGRVEAGERVLVMCGAGISRSATFVLAALLERGHDIREAFALLREQHYEATPHPAMWRSLIVEYELDLTLGDALQLMRRRQPGDLDAD